MPAAIASALSVIVAALIGLAGYSGGWILAAAVGLAVLALAAGWGPMLELPDPVGSAVLIAGTGIAALAVAELAGGSTRPLAAFAAVLACAVVASFGHELVRRGSRPNVVESVTGTVTGQVVAVLAAGWLLLPDVGGGVTGVLVAAVAVAGARVAGAIPAGRLTPWLAFALGGAAAAAVTRVETGLSLVTAGSVGLAVAAVVAALDRLLAPGNSLQQRTTGLLAGAAAPVAAAGTVAYAALRLVTS